MKHEIDLFRSEEERKILSEYPIICATLVTSLYYVLNRFKFNHIIIDEAAQALEPESALCLLKHPSHIVLIGDTKQLGCFLKSRSSGSLGLGVPMIERLLDIGVPNCILNTQYRMHPHISQFPNCEFYDSYLIDGITCDDREYPNFSFPSPIEKSATFFYDVASIEEIGGNGLTSINRYETEAIIEILDYFYESYINGAQIGIITFYDGQRGYLRNYLEEYYKSTNYVDDKNIDNSFINEIEIMSVDSCQGREFDFVLLSCVKASENFGIGFLSEYRRVNVALTRAKYGLIIIGNSRALLKNTLWGDLVSFYNHYELIFTGKFNALKSVHLNLDSEQRFILERKLKYKK